jgi:Fibronectin type III domain
VSRNFRSVHRPTGRGLTLLLIAAAAALCPAAAVRALGATHRPDPPTHLRATGVTRTALTLAWTRSTGPGRIARYRVFKDERRIGHTPGKARFAVSGLRCGRTYSFSVRAVDRRGRVSHPASRLIRTAACATSDTEPPSTPADLAQSEPTRTGLELAWSPSVDNVRVSGYRVTHRRDEPLGRRPLLRDVLRVHRHRI